MQSFDFAFINSTNDLILIALVVLLLFGANKIPEMMRGLGQGMRELKRGLNSEEEPGSSADPEREARIRAKVEEEVRRRREAERRTEREV